ncbi:7053_t:CDS:2 [Acaulospora morrowiae]|uniref:serine--tRNA ligase n=1 Tax=Acaulospora morrowiae TaxID=94023 RepID=A0A9N8VTM4_9GLOM|nr:7053_t:CDS:2 [Acaulospora morrowiae]
MSFRGIKILDQLFPNMTWAQRVVEILYEQILMHFLANSEKISQNILNRNLKDADISLVNCLYTKFCSLTSLINSKRNQRNEITKKIKSIQDKNEKNKLVEQAKEIKEEIQKMEVELVKVEEEMLMEGLKIPNDTHEEVRVGGEEVSRVVKIVGNPLGESLEPVDFSTSSRAQIDPIVRKTTKDHIEIAKKFDLIDFEAASTVTGTSWYYLRNAGALLELALIQYAMQKLIAKGYTPVITPDVVRTEFSNACGFQPRDDELSQNYFVSTDAHISPGDSASYQRTLAATAEIPLAGIYAGKILSPSQLPIRMVGFGRAFRAEAGARGQDAKGLYRVHQFSKVEIFCLTRPEESNAMLNEIVNIQEEIFRELELCFRHVRTLINFWILDMPTYELGASAYRKFDIEAWMPGRGRWGEISSASNCTDYQSRRLNIRYKPSISLQEQVGNNANNIAGQKAQQTQHTEFVHTLNGTAIAVPRMIIAILENFQRDDGKVTIPKVLRNWMCGMKEIG